jgi:hypothetical protein
MKWGGAATLSDVLPRVCPPTIEVKLLP